jgi:hypothetical protein
MKNRMQTSLPNFKMLAIIIFTLSFHGCGGVSIEPQRQEPAANSNHTRFLETTPTPPQPETAVAEFLKKEFNPIEEQERTGILRAWGRVGHRETYFAGPHEYGEIAGAWGLAMIVRDNSITSAKKSSLLAFIRRPGNRFDLYWIYRNEDLSRLGLSRLSGDIMVSGTREDGTAVNCEIAWSRKDNRWTCLSL